MDVNISHKKRVSLDQPFMVLMISGARPALHRTSRFLLQLQ